MFMFWRLLNSILKQGKKKLDNLKMLGEKKFYLIVWIISIIIAIFKFIKSCGNHPIVNPDDFVDGWSFLHRMKDNSDVEWTILTSVFKKYYPILIVQVLCTNLFLRGKRNARSLFYAVYSTCSIILVVGVTVSSAFLFYIGVMYLIHLTGKKHFCYLLTICSVFFLHDTRFVNVKELLGLEGLETESFLFEVGLAWLLAKSLSFAVDRIERKQHQSSSDISIILAYCLYIPAFFTGPILSYESFCKEMLKGTNPISLRRVLLPRVLYLIYQLSFYFIYEFLLHYIYSLSVSYYPDDVVSTFDRWSICGLSYALPLMFYIKYFTLYGVAGSISRLEDITLPPPPKCISSIHLSSFLYRHFDRGLYLWLLRYLYHPMLNSGVRRIFALSLCFGFVSLWHGSDSAICVSSAINWFLVSSEVSAKRLLTTKIGKKFQKLSPTVRERFIAAFATPHFILLCTSCTFFLSNYDIGVLLVERMLLGGIMPLATLAFVMYCGCHVSVNVKKFQGNNPVSIGFVLGK